MIYAVVGLLFSTDRRSVALIQKRRPAFHAGLLNGIGGKLNDNESFGVAMEREFREETGVTITSWERFAVIRSSKRWEVHFYRAFDDAIFRVWATTDEMTYVVPVEFINFYATTPNLLWLLPMALCPAVQNAVIDDNEIDRHEKNLPV